MQQETGASNKRETVEKVRAQVIAALAEYDASMQGRLTSFVRLDPREIDDVHVLREYLKRIKRFTVLNYDGARAFNNLQLVAKGVSSLNEHVPITRMLFDARGLPKQLEKSREDYVHDLGLIAQDYPEITAMQGPEVRLSARIVEDIAAVHAANKAVDAKREIQKKSAAAARVAPASPGAATATSGATEGPVPLAPVAAMAQNPFSSAPWQP